MWSGNWHGIPSGRVGGKKSWDPATYLNSGGLSPTPMCPLLPNLEGSQKSPPLQLQIEQNMSDRQAALITVVVMTLSHDVSTSSQLCGSKGANY